MFAHRNTGEVLHRFKVGRFQSLALLKEQLKNPVGDFQDSMLANRGQERGCLVQLTLARSWLIWTRRTSVAFASAVGCQGKASAGHEVEFGAFRS